jgi:DNA repair protein RadD
VTDTETDAPVKPRIVPYDFQADGATALIESAGHPLAVYATGAGKSVVIAEVCRRLLSRSVILVPTRELCQQNEQAMRAVWPEVDVGILCAGLRRREYGARNLIATIQSVYSLWKRDKLGLIGSRDLMIVDEAHLVPASEVGMYRTIIKALEPSKVMGLTATPYRLESGRLDEGDDRLFDRVVYEFGMYEGINWRGPNGERLLLPLIAKKTATAIDTSGVKIRHGDFVEKELEARANTGDMVFAAVDEIQRYGVGRKRWLAFCCGADHAEHVAQVLNARGIAAAAITYHTSSDTRRETIAAYRRGELSCLCGCNIFTTGFNVQEVDLIAFLRPTKSPGLYVQMGGRGTRYADDKTDCLILDFARNVERLGPIDAPRMPEAKKLDESKAGRSTPEMKACPECHTYTPQASSYCSECGHVFEREPPPPKHDVVASDLPIMSTDDLIWMPVAGLTVWPHRKEGAPPSVKLLFRTAGGLSIAKWLPIEHPRARIHAQREWAQLGGNQPAPDSTAEAVRRRNEISVPAAIGVKRVGAFWQIHKVRHADAG